MDRFSGRPRSSLEDPSWGSTGPTRLNLEKRLELWDLHAKNTRKIPGAPKTMKKYIGFGHLKNQLITIHTSKHVGFGLVEIIQL